MQTVKPAPLQIWCKPLKEVTQTNSGIFLKEDGDEGSNKSSLAEVLAIGKEVTLYKPKETIIFREYAALEIELGEIGNKESYYIIEEQDVVGTLID